MASRHAVLLNPLEATLVGCLPSCKQNAPITYLESTPARPLISVADKGLITPLEATLTNTPHHNFFRSNTCKKHGGWGSGAMFHFNGPFDAAFHLPYTLPSSVSCNPFVCHSYEKRPGCGGILPILELPAHHRRVRENHLREVTVGTKMHSLSSLWRLP
jgi:hypothetical protein